MTIQDTEVGLRARTVGEIAATVPGATSVFRRFKIDFCCHGDMALDVAARQRGVDSVDVEREIAALIVEAKVETPLTAMGSDELIDHIKIRYHETHRRALPELIALSQKVEAVHRGHPKVPAGLSAVLEEMLSELVPHMITEETVLFPAISRHVEDGLDIAIDDLRHEHDDQGALLRRLEAVTGDFALPEGACRSWQALYVGTARLAEDLMEHIHLENNVLFPRFTKIENRA